MSASRYVGPPTSAHWGVFASVATLAAQGAGRALGEWHVTRPGVVTGDDVVFMPGEAALLDAFFARGSEYAAGPHGALLLLAAAGVRPRVVGAPSGHDLFYQGRLDEFEALRAPTAAALREALAATGGGPVVCQSAEDAHAVRDLLGIDAVHVTEFLRGRDIALKAPGGERPRVAYFDPCRLGRYRGAYDAPRELLARVADVVDLGYPRGEEPCCGVSAWLNCNSWSKGHREAILRRAVDAGATVLATACPMCQAHLECYYCEPAQDADGPSRGARVPRVRIADVCELVAELGGLRPAGGPRLGAATPPPLWSSAAPLRPVAAAPPAAHLEGGAVRAAHLCTLCMRCVEECPQGAPILGHVMRVRGALHREGLTPARVAAMVGPIASHGNPFSEPRCGRTDAYPPSLAARVAVGAGTGRPVPEALLFVGCVHSYQDPRALAALARIVEASGADVAVLGEDEGCCGYVAHLAGAEDEFRATAAATAGRVRAIGAGLLVTPCAGCHRTFATLYPAAVPGWPGTVRVLHLVEWLDVLIAAGRLPLARDGAPLTVAYHDPCDLGRHQGVYDAPRRVLQALPGVRLVEFPDAREGAECCGGGGALRAYDEGVARRVGEGRLSKLPAGVDVVASACPSCKGNLRLAATSIARDGGPKPRVLDVLEVVASRLEGGEGR